MISGKLKINDQEFVFSEKALIVYLSTLEEAMSCYIETVAKIKLKAFEDTSILNKLEGLLNDMEIVYKNIQEVTSVINGKAKEFIREIDEKDKFIY